MTKVGLQCLTKGGEEKQEMALQGAAPAVGALWCHVEEERERERRKSRGGEVAGMATSNRVTLAVAGAECIAFLRQAMTSTCRSPYTVTHRYLDPFFDSFTAVAWCCLGNRSSHFVGG